jgi:hypothetical protein
MIGRAASLLDLTAVFSAGCGPKIVVPFLEPGAAVVDGHDVPMRVYRERLEVSRHRDPLAGIEAAVPSPLPAQRLEDFTIDQLVREEIVRQEAERRGIKISDRAVDARIATLRSQAGAEAFEAAVRRNGFTSESFKGFERALLAEVALVKVMARERVRAVEEALRSGRSFASVAGQWSDDSGTAAKGGDIGWIVPGELPERELAAAVKTLDSGGQPSTIETARGYVADAVLERRGEEVHLAVIVILAPAIDLYSAESRPSWFDRWVSIRRESLVSDGRIQFRVGSRSGG